MTKQIEKYRAMADRLAKDIAAKRAPRDTNTPKRAMQAKSALIDADHLERVRDACLVLAASSRRMSKSN